jgi:hypothetical protein
LARSQLTCRIPQVLFQLRQIVGELLPVLRQFIALLHSGLVLLLVGRSRLPGHTADTIRLAMLFLAETIAFARKGIEFARSLLLLCAAHQARSLAKLVRRPPRCLGTLPLPGATLHLFVSAAQPVQSLRYTRVGSIATAIGLRSTRLRRLRLTRRPRRPTRRRPTR